LVIPAGLAAYPGRLNILRPPPIDDVTRTDMNDNALSVLAQVYPVLLLALMWDSGFLTRLASQDRLPRRVDPVHGVRFWTKRRVRIFALIVTNLLIADTALAVLILGGVRGNAVTTVLLASGLVLALGTLCTRIWLDVATATRDKLATPSAPSVCVHVPRRAVAEAVSNHVVLPPQVADVRPGTAPVHEQSGNGSDPA
jgi:hypothetical protein